MILNSIIIYTHLRHDTVELVSIRMASEFFSSSRRISVRSSVKAKFKHSFQGRMRSGDLMKKIRSPF